MRTEVIPPQMQQLDCTDAITRTKLNRFMVGKKVPKQDGLATYSLRPKILVILEILRQINKKVKWPRLPLYYIHIWH